MSIPFSKPDITPKELERVSKVISSGWLTHGPYTEKFENLFCKITGAKYCVTVSNCTAGLHLSCLAAGFGEGDEVIVPAQTHTATSHAVELTGARAIFADVEPISGNIDMRDFKSKISSKTKGVIPVHMAGYSCEMNELVKISDENNLIIIEDCAHALGTKYSSKHVGNYGITGNFSFYPTKQITTGEGGMVITNDKKIYDFIRTHKAFGIDTPIEMRKKPGLYDVKSLGLNYRMTDFQAALGLGQLERYKENLNLRKANAYSYTEFLSDVDEINFLPYKESHSYFLFQIFLNEKMNRDDFLRHLKKMEIGFSIHYATPVPLMSYYKNKYGYRSGDFPNAEEYANTSISLPVHSGLRIDDIKYIVDAIKEQVNSYV